MRRSLVCSWVLALGCLLLGGLGGCSSGDTKADSAPPKKDGRVDGKVVPDTAGQPDVSKVDSKKPDSRPSNSKLGEGCAGNKDCTADAPLCLRPSGTDIGICSMECTPDDSSTPLINEDNCPTDFICATFSSSAKDVHYCLQKCQPSLTQTNCPASSKRTCHPQSTRYGDLDVAVCWYLACQTNKDCPVFAAKTCVADPDCTSIGADAFCDSTEGQCARPGNCTKGGICGVHTLGKATAKVGDPCKSAFDCPNAGMCTTEGSDTGATGVSYRNGYCMIPNCSFAKQLPEFKCPAGSTCHNLYYGGNCFKTCDLATASDCRGYAGDKGGDYECYAWNNFVTSGTSAPVTDGPICASAASQACTDFGTKDDCTSLGTSGNPTNMTCRDRYTGVKKTNIKDPVGVCLDDTASGPFEAAAPVEAGPDKGTKDAGTKASQ